MCVCVCGVCDVCVCESERERDRDDDDDRLFMACPVSKEPRALTKADEYALDRDREE